MQSLKKFNSMTNKNYLDLTSDQEPVVRDRLVNLNHSGYYILPLMDNEYLTPIPTKCKVVKVTDPSSRMQCILVEWKGILFDFYFNGSQRVFKRLTYSYNSWGHRSYKTFEYYWKFEEVYNHIHLDRIEKVLGEYADAYSGTDKAYDMMLQTEYVQNAKMFDDVTFDDYAEFAGSFNKPYVEFDDDKYGDDPYNDEFVKKYPRYMSGK